MYALKGIIHTTTLVSSFLDKVHPSQAILPGELFYYYSGDCTNASVQEKIKNNFVEVMENLEGTDGWGNICPDYCSVDSVTVTCGPLNGRRRRWTKNIHLMFKRSATSQIILNFNIKADWQLDKNLWENEDSMMILGTFIQDKVSTGEFDVPGTTTGDADYGVIDFECPLDKNLFTKMTLDVVGFNNTNF